MEVDEVNAINANGENSVCDASDIQTLTDKCSSSTSKNSLPEDECKSLEHASDSSNSCSKFNLNREKSITDNDSDGCAEDSFSESAMDIDPLCEAEIVASKEQDHCSKYGEKDSEESEEASNFLCSDESKSSGENEDKLLTTHTNFSEDDTSTRESDSNKLPSEVNDAINSHKITDSADNNEDKSIYPTNVNESEKFSKDKTVMDYELSKKCSAEETCVTDKVDSDLISNSRDSERKEMEVDTCNESIVIQEDYDEIESENIDSEAQSKEECSATVATPEVSDKIESENLKYKTPSNEECSPAVAAPTDNDKVESENLDSEAQSKEECLIVVTSSNASNAVEPENLDSEMLSNKGLAESTLQNDDCNNLEMEVKTVVNEIISTCSEEGRSEVPVNKAVLPNFGKDDNTIICKNKDLVTCNKTVTSDFDVSSIDSNIVCEKVSDTDFPLKKGCQNKIKRKSTLSMEESEVDKKLEVCKTNCVNSEKLMREEDSKSTLLATSFNNISSVPLSSSVSMNKDIPIGEIVELEDIGDSTDENGEMHLKISNVVGGELCITGLASEDEKDLLPIQISSVTSLIDPISPESSRTNSEIVSDFSIAKDEINDAKLDESDDKHTANKGTPMLRISKSVLAEIGEISCSSEVDQNDKSDKEIFIINRNHIHLPHRCLICMKQDDCLFRVVKKYDTNAVAYLCSIDCRETWKTKLRPNQCVEKPRTFYEIFNRFCGMCSVELIKIENNVYSWETSEFCSHKCLSLYIREIAGYCHLCNQAVRILYMGKYCVRFGSDVHQFCSNLCLEGFKNSIKVCCYCQKNLKNVQTIPSVSAKQYCCQKCLKRAQRRDVGQPNHSELANCTVCQAQSVYKFEFLLNGEFAKLCSELCLNTFKYANNVKSVSCCLCLRNLNPDDITNYIYHGSQSLLRVFCSDSCLNVFILSTRKIVSCQYCKVKKYNYDMIQQKQTEIFYCSLCCLDVAEGRKGIKEVETAGKQPVEKTIVEGSKKPTSKTICNMCETLASAQFHMVMSDGSLVNFCSYPCASRYRNTFGFKVSDDSNLLKESTESNSKPEIAVVPPTNSISTVSNQAIKKCYTNKKMTTILTEMEQTAEFLKLLEPVSVQNKMTFCKPHTLSRSTLTKPDLRSKGTMTDEYKSAAILPVPIPIYVPTPVMMYSVPTPVPIFVPIPVPVPILIPTMEESADALKKKIDKVRNIIPDDPYEAEMILLARDSIESDTTDNVPQIKSEAIVEKALEETDFNPAIEPFEGREVEFLDNLEEFVIRCPPLKHLEIEENSFGSADYTDNPVEKSRKRRASSFEDDDYVPNLERRKRRRGRGRGRGRGRPRKLSDDSSGSDAESIGNIESTELSVPLESADEIQVNHLYGIMAWRHWVKKKNAELSVVSSARNVKLIKEDLLNMSSEELNHTLCLFLRDLKKPNGEDFQPDSVFYILLGVQQYLFEHGKTHCIFLESNFEKFTTAFDDVIKNFVSIFQTPDPVSHDVITGSRITEEMLWECKQLGAHTPYVLLNTLFYFNTKEFHLKTVEDHQSLAFVQIIKQWRRKGNKDSTHVSVLRYQPKKAVKDSDKCKHFEMHENVLDPLRCPVKLFEFYLSKCPESVKADLETYYVYPERSCMPDSPVWFSTQPVTTSGLQKMLNRTIMVQDVQNSLANRNYS